MGLKATSSEMIIRGLNEIYDQSTLFRQNKLNGITIYPAIVNIYHCLQTD